MGGGDWHQKWLNSPEFAKVKQEITQLKEQAMANPLPDEGAPKEYATSFGFQLKTVLKRSEYQSDHNRLLLRPFASAHDTREWGQE